MSWWGYDDSDYDYMPKQETEKKKESEEEFPTWNQRVCIHLWKPTILIVSTVYDCSKCGIKKEEYEEWQKKRNPF